MAQPANRRLVTEAALAVALDGIDPLPDGGTAGQVLTKTATGEAWQAVPSGLPSGGSTGHVVVKTAAGSAWAPVPKELPEGGSAGQVLARTAEGITWTAPPTGIPSGGTAGQVLTKTATGESWSNAPTEIPAGGSTGQTLMRTATGVGWGTPQAAGASWDADKLAIARGFYEVVSATEPTVTAYTASDGKTYPVVWLKPITKTVPVLPQEPYWSRPDSTVTVPDLVGVDYHITGYSKDGGSTWTETSILIPGGVASNVKTLTGQALPMGVRVKATAEPGYVLPSESAFIWTHDFPDPNATVVITSDTFARADGLLELSMSDAALGGTPKQWGSGNGVIKIVNGQAIVGFAQGQLALDVGAVNMEVEFDLVRNDGQTGAVGPNMIQVFVGSTGGWNSGFGFGGTGRVYYSSDNILSPLLQGGTLMGHYKMSIVGTTATITPPSGVTYTYTVGARAENQTRFMIQAWTQATPTFGIDNLVIRRVGY